MYSGAVLFGCGCQLQSTPLAHSPALSPSMRLGVSESTGNETSLVAFGGVAYQPVVHQQLKDATKSLTCRALIISRVTRPDTFKTFLDKCSNVGCKLARAPAVLNISFTASCSGCRQLLGCQNRTQAHRPPDLPDTNPWWHLV